MTRYGPWVGFGLGWALAGALLLGLFARPDPGAPWYPAQVLATDPQSFESSASVLEVRDGSLVITGADSNGVASAMLPVEPFDASSLPLARYRLAEVPTESRALLLWRADGVLHSVLLPEVFGGGVIRPSRDSGWHGTVDAVGIAVAPVDYLSGDAVAVQKITVHALQFESVSWRGALASLTSGWLTHRPWSGRSINTGGFELGNEPGASLQLLLASWCASGVFLATLLLGWRTRRRWMLPIALLGVGLLAAQQLVQLLQRTHVVVVAAGLADRQLQPLSAQPALAAAAAQLLTMLQTYPRRERILVLGDDRFGREYLTWLLRQHDVATIENADDIVLEALPTQGVMVVVGMDAARFDPRSSHLTVGSMQLPARELAHTGQVRAYRFDNRAAAP